MFKPETLARVDEIIAKLNYAADKEFVQGMVNEIERLQKKVKQQEERISEYSWAASGGDRMGGGWTDSEILEYQRGGW